MLALLNYAPSSLSNLAPHVKPPCLTPLDQVMDPETKLLHQNTKDSTMPITIVTTMSSSSPLTSARPHHVLQITLTLLSKLDIIVSQIEHDNALDNSWSPRPGAPERAQAWPRARQNLCSPRHLTLPSTSHFTHLLAKTPTSPGHRQLARRCPVTVAVDDDRPPVHRPAPSTQLTPPSLLAPAASPRRQQPSGHAHRPLHAL
jgi:hypothetical protein